jgi:hypothetical protein
MSQLAERFISTGQPGGTWSVLCGFVAARLQGHGWHEPYKSRDLRTVLWAAGGVIPPADPAALEEKREARLVQVSIRETNESEPSWTRR